MSEMMHTDIGIFMDTADNIELISRKRHQKTTT